MPIIIDEISPEAPRPEGEPRKIDPDAPQEWTATHWEEGGGEAHDNKGNLVYFEPDGKVVTVTPTGTSMVLPDGTAYEDRMDEYGRITPMVAGEAVEMQVDPSFAEPPGDAPSEGL